MIAARSRSRSRPKTGNQIIGCLPTPNERPERTFGESLSTKSNPTRESMMTIWKFQQRVMVNYFDSSDQGFKPSVCHWSMFDQFDQFDRGFPLLFCHFGWKPILSMFLLLATVLHLMPSEDIPARMKLFSNEFSFLQSRSDVTETSPPKPTIMKPKDSLCRSRP